MDRKPKVRAPSSSGEDVAAEMAEVPEIPGETANSTTGLSDFPERSGKLEPEGRFLRLREAVRRAGGNKAVASRAGIPVSTLGDYVAGGEWKFSTALALAAACDVSLEWLATGNEYHPSGETVAERQSTENGKGLFETVDIIQLSKAFDFVEGALDRRNATLPTIERARAILLAYDLMQMERLTDSSGKRS